MSRRAFSSLLILRMSASLSWDAPPRVVPLRHRQHFIFTPTSSPLVERPIPDKSGSLTELGQSQTSIPTSPEMLVRPTQALRRRKTQLTQHRSLRIHRVKQERKRTPQIPLHSHRATSSHIAVPLEQAQEHSPLPPQASMQKARWISSFSLEVVQLVFQ